MLRLPSSVVKRLPGGLSCWRGPNVADVFSMKKLFGGLIFVDVCTRPDYTCSLSERRAWRLVQKISERVTTLIHVVML